MKQSSVLLFLAIPVLVLGLAACNSSGGYQDGLALTSVNGTGFLQVHLTDTPIDLSTVESVIVTIDEVIVYPCDDDWDDNDDCDPPYCDCDDPDCDDPDCDCSDPDCDDPDCDDDMDDDDGDDSGSGCANGPIVIMDHPETFDLLTLTDGATDLLAEAALPTCEYCKIRLRIQSATMTLNDGTMVDLKIDSHKVDINIPFTITEDEMMSIILDFEADASIKVNETGSDKYILRPVVNPVWIGS